MAKIELTFDEMCAYLHNLKVERGMNYGQIADRSGVHDVTIKSYLLGEVKNRSARIVEDIAAGMGVKVQEKYIIEVDGEAEPTVNAKELKGKIDTFMHYTPLFHKIADVAVCRVVCKEIMGMIDKMVKEN